MEESDTSVPRSSNTAEEEQLNTDQTLPNDVSAKEQQAPVETSEKKPDNKSHQSDKKKKKRNLWPLKALVISLLLAFAVNALSSVSLTGARLWVTVVVTVLILVLGVLFDMIGTAATSCDIGPFLAMASRKVKGGKTAVKLAKKRDIVSSVCCDIVGDICGIVSGVCAATIAAKEIFSVESIGAPANFWVSVAIYAVISMATITLKAVGKGIAVKKANGIIFAVAKVLSIFSKKG